jgi:tyrosinase
VISHNKNSYFAHLGPAFLPWHRKFLLNFEADLQRVSKNANLMIPYWDWSNNVTRMNIWTPSYVGGNGSATDHVITDGPFVNWGITYERNGLTSSGIRRALSTPLGSMPDMHMDMGNSNDIPILPDINEVMMALMLDTYDSPPYNDSSHEPRTFRNTFEGWEKEGCKLHNTVHLWIGGHMRSVAISVNDPVFWLHHAFVDKIYDLWQRLHYPNDVNGGYLPVVGARKGHNLHDIMSPFIGTTPFHMVNMKQLGYMYEYDELDEAVTKQQMDLPDSK